MIIRLGLLCLTFFICSPNAFAAQWLEPLQRCKNESGKRPRWAWQCADLKVKMDYSGKVKGSLKIGIAYWKRHQTDRAVLALAGGPGQAGSPYAFNALESMSPYRNTHNFLIVNQRGTGDFALNCPQIQKSGKLLDSYVMNCQKRLGKTAPFFASQDSVRDFEEIRKKLGIRKFTIYAVSYGAHPALGYAAQYPERVEQVVLSSPSSPLNTLTWRKSLQGIGRFFESYCPKRCASFTPSVLDDLAWVIKELDQARVKKLAVGDTTVKLSTESLITMIYTGDSASDYWKHTPAALASARLGDWAPLARLSYEAEVGLGQLGPIKDFSAGAYIATHCSDLPRLWGATTSYAKRITKLKKVMFREPAGFYPFSPLSSFHSTAAKPCARWKSGPRPLKKLVPKAPTLILVGMNDVITTIEEAEELAALGPNFKLLKVPNTTHDVFGSSGEECPGRILKLFYLGEPFEPVCEGDNYSLEVSKPVPRRLEEVKVRYEYPELVSKTLSAVAYSWMDMEGALDRSDPTEFGGLRSGKATLVKTKAGPLLKVRNYSAVEGVKIEGDLHLRGSNYAHGTVRVIGGAGGTLTLSKGGELTGKLGDTEVRTELWRYNSSLPETEEELQQPMAVE